ncbi:MAG: SDR family oxidoreductase [Kofleriaceae bacterium]
MSGSAYAQRQAQLAAAPERWLVTGCAGFIGSALVEQLLALGQEVVGVDSFITGHRRNLDEVLGGAGAAAARFTFLEGDLRDLAVARAAVAGVSRVLHQAALGSVPRSLADPLATHAHNVDGFLNVLVAARDAKVRHLVYASSSSVYGDHPGLPKVEDAIGAPLSPYAASKRVDEVYAGVFARAYGMQLTGLRYFNVFGRRQDPDGAYAAVIPRWTAALLAGAPCTIFGDGSSSRDFCYVDNVVQANLLAATAPTASAHVVYNVGCNGRTDLRELFALIRDALAAHRPEVARAEPAFAPPRAGDVPHSQASIDKISAALGYQPTHTIAEGIGCAMPYYLGRAGA